MKLIWVVIFLMVPVLANADTVGQLPPQLVYKDKPIDALCLVAIKHLKGLVDLDKCGLHSESGRAFAGENKQLLAQGYVGYDYTIRVNSTVNMHGYSYYKLFGTVGSAAIVQTINHGGGSGDVSSLSLIERKGKTMHVSVLNTGDRCNHGLIDMRRERDATGERLVYRKKLTTYDFLTLTHDNPHHLKAYDDVSDCAVCCKATAVYQRQIGAAFAHETMRYVDLASFPQAPGEAQAPQPYQACFDTLLKKYVKAGQPTLNPEQLAVFVREFNAQCVG